MKYWGRTFVFVLFFMVGDYGVMPQKMVGDCFQDFLKRVGDYTPRHQKRAGDCLSECLWMVGDSVHDTILREGEGTRACRVVN